MTADELRGADGVLLSLDAFPPDTRPHIKDHISGRWILLDSGAARAVWPHSAFPGAKQDINPRLRAANGSLINTFGTRKVHLKFGSLKLAALVTVADVKRQILGWDWVTSNQLQILRKGNRYFLDFGRKQVALAMAGPAAGSLGISAAEGTFQHWSQQQTVKAGRDDQDDPPAPRYAKLLADFPGIDRPDFKRKPLATHHIDTGDKPPCRSPVRYINATSPKYVAGKAAWD